MTLTLTGVSIYTDFDSNENLKNLKNVRTFPLPKLT